MDAPAADVPATEAPALARLFLLVSLAARPFGRVHEARWSISVPEWRVLVAILDRPGVSGSELSQLLGLDKMAISRAVRVLERAGHVTRTAATGDVRRQALACTEQGEALCRTMGPQDRALEQALLGALSPEEAAQFLAVLDRLVDRARHAAVV